MAETHPLRTASQRPRTNEYKDLNRQAEIVAKNCQRVEMPSLDHLTSADYENVYEPAEDTYLLLDGLGLEFDDMRSQGMERETLSHDVPTVTLELGCGTGVVTTYLANILLNNRKRRLERNSKEAGYSHSAPTPSTVNYATDINIHAVSCALRTAKASGLPQGAVEAVLCDLASPLLGRLAGKVDVILFNPPYVPTPDDEVGGNGIEASWAGGKDGRVVLDKALPQIARLLSWPNGAAYIITVDDNMPEELAGRLMEGHGILLRPLVRRRARNEFLTVQKLTLTRHPI